MNTPTHPLSYGSVCSGIEAATVAWHPLGWQPAWFSEIERLPCAVLAHHYPHVPNLGDMTGIAAKIRAGTVTAPDILVGGTPCQAFSTAGRRHSLADARGNLTLAFVELAHAIDQVRAARGEPPVIVVWENVPGVLSTADNAFGCFLAGLAGEDAALRPPGRKWTNAGAVYGPGRAIAWRTLDAQYFELAQRRKRVFVVASARDRFDPAAILFEWDRVRRDSAPRRTPEEDLARTLEASAGHHGHGSPRGDGNDNLIADVVPPLLSKRPPGTENDPLASLMIVDEHADETGQPDAMAFAQNQRDEVRLLDVAGAIAAQPGMKQQTFVAFDCSASEVTVGLDIVPTMRARNHMHSHAAGNGHLAVTEPMTLALRGREAGMDLEYRQDGTANALLTPSGGRAGMGVGAIAQAMAQAQILRVRRLTPLECERLQGFPDQYTQVLVPVVNRRGDIARFAPTRDGPRYRALGNSMAVPCMRWIAERIEQFGYLI